MPCANHNSLLIERITDALMTQLSALNTPEEEESLNTPEEDEEESLNTPEKNDYGEKNEYGCRMPGPEWFPLYNAVDTGTLADVRAALKGAEGNPDAESFKKFIEADKFFINQFGQRCSYGTALRRAVSSGWTQTKIDNQFKVVSLLLEKGADPNSILNEHCSILETAVMHNCDDNVVQILEQYGAQRMWPPVKEQLF
jgi:hypothetical protein